MSQDLLAEFGSFTVSSPQHQGAVTSQNGLSPTPIAQINTLGGSQSQQGSGITNNRTNEDLWAEEGEDGEEDDDFGDFEEASNEVLPDDMFAQPPPQKTEAPVKTTPVSKVINKVSKPKPAKSKEALSKNHPFANMSDILFDAEFSDEEGMFEVIPEPRKVDNDDDDDDDFGNFETTAPPRVPVKKTAPVKKPSKPQVSQPATFDLLGLDEDFQPSPPISNKASVSVAPPKAKSSTSKGPSQARAPVSKPKEVKPDADDDFAEWDDFESLPAKTTQSPTNAPPTSTSHHINIPTSLIGNLITPALKTPSPAPSNIPPPSLLLSLFPPLFKDTSTHFLHPLSSLPSDQKQSFLTLADARLFLKNYLTAAHVLSHIIAGRKNRWKRDKFLAQSMRIGPSVSGRSGGMKLAGLDANEGRREDAEAEDVLRVWKEQIGRLKSAVTVASVGVDKKALPIVPDMALTMPIRIARTAEGGVVSTHACALCGLKREERVAKVDVEVEDSFGEWWIEGTNMHLACWNFWEVHKDGLRGR